MEIQMYYLTSMPSTNHRNYKGSTYNIMVGWDNGETTIEALQIIAKYDLVIFAVYAKDNGFLDAPGWKHYK
jgi:hypothetical protein